MDNMQKVLDTYEVNPNTMIILPKTTPKSPDICSFVKEVEDEFIVLQNPTEIIQHSCSFFGSSYRGRVAGTQTLTGITHKPPIAINPSNELFFFPTTAATHHECAWVSPNHVRKVDKAPHRHVTVLFSNCSSITLDISIGSFENQLHRTTKLIFAYSSRNRSQQEPRKFDYVHKSEIDEYIKKKLRTD